MAEVSVVGKPCAAASKGRLGILDFAVARNRYFAPRAGAARSRGGAGGHVQELVSRAALHNPQTPLQHAPASRACAHYTTGRGPPLP
eukprot:1913125-Prymnesium_polylepis.1